MRGYRFYAEYDSAKDKRADKHSGNVCAVLLDEERRPLLNRPERNNATMADAIAAGREQKNSPVCLTTVSLDYLREKCKRISEERARAIHPRLFNYLDS